MTYHHFVLTISLAEHLDTHFARLDSYNKGYQKTPDIKLICKIGYSVDVAVIELKYDSNKLSIEQINYLSN